MSQSANRTGVADRHDDYWFYVFLVIFRLFIWWFTFLYLCSSLCKFIRLLCETWMLNSELNWMNDQRQPECVLFWIDIWRDWHTALTDFEKMICTKVVDDWISNLFSPKWTQLVGQFVFDGSGSFERARLSKERSHRIVSVVSDASKHVQTWKWPSCFFWSFVNEVLKILLSRTSFHNFLKTRQDLTHRASLRRQFAGTGVTERAVSARYHTDRRLKRLTDRSTDKQTDRQTGQTDRLTKLYKQTQHSRSPRAFTIAVALNISPEMLFDTVSYPYCLYFFWLNISGKQKFVE